MAKRLSITKSKNSESFYVIEDFTDPKTKKKSTTIYEKLGNLQSLFKKYNTDSRDVVLSNLKDYVETLKEKDKLDNQPVTVTFQMENQIEFKKDRNYNIGYLYIQNILSSLGLKKICDNITQKHKFKYDFYRIFNDQICARIIEPGSKRSSFEAIKQFIEQPNYELEDIYRSLRVMAQNRYEIEAELYKNSTNEFDRNTSVLYYDCTNFYFEIEDEREIAKYGKSKKNRPNPIVQYGLFMDGDGIPIADIVFPGNNNEQFSMSTLEKQIEKDFGLSRFIVCADAGLNGWENKVYNDRKEIGAYIVTQPIKKLSKKLKAWALDPKGWSVIGSKQKFDISQLGETVNINGKTYKTNSVIFYKDTWEHQTKKTEQLDDTKYKLEQHYIVSFSTKFQKYQQNIREKKLERARKLLSNPGKIAKANERDPRYFIKETVTTKDGEIGEVKEYEINLERVEDAMKYDGFYCVTTDLEDGDIGEVINANKRRWEIEECFEIMKSDLKTRPMYVTLQEAIEGHTLICFTALLAYRILEKKYLNEDYTINTIMKKLRKMTVLNINGPYYVPTFMRDELTDKLDELFGFTSTKEIITQKQIKKFLRVTKAKKITKLK